jgi:hypothetical protein
MEHCQVLRSFLDESRELPGAGFLKIQKFVSWDFKGLH